MRSLAMPRVWTADELRDHRLHSQGLFTALRREDGPKSFQRAYNALHPAVERVFSATSDMRSFTGELFRDDPAAWQVCRYLCAPPISQEDLWTLVGGSKFRRVPPALAEETADALRVVLDPIRFPWLAEGRGPTPEERDRAVMATTIVYAVQHLATERRGDASTTQERLTGEALHAAGYAFEPSRKTIQFIDELSRGHYSRERVLGSSKCDVPIRLLDGRLLALECKVSNGPKNGWKRVNREVGGKADTWRMQFGTQVITGVVLAGVFDQKCLADAQEKGVALFWQHDLEQLINFIEQCGGSDE